eukprot:1428021-Prymnesium_polylepis.1
MGCPLETRSWARSGRSDTRLYLGRDAWASKSKDTPAKDVARSCMVHVVLAGTHAHGPMSMLRCPLAQQDSEKGCNKGCCPTQQPPPAHPIAHG